MKFLKKILIFLVFALLLAAFFYYLKDRMLGEPAEEKIITSQELIDEIRLRYPLAEKTLLYSGEAELAMSEAENARSARGTVNIVLSIDFDYFSANDIVIDHVNKNAIVYLPAAKIKGVSIKDDLEIRDAAGVWIAAKDFFPPEKEALRGQAAQALIAVAEEYASGKDDFFAEAYDAGSLLIGFLLENRLVGYHLEINAK